MVYVADLQPGIHPTMKADYAKRAALVAQATVYGQDVIAQGPTYLSHAYSETGCVVTFADVGDGLATAVPW